MQELTPYRKTGEASVNALNERLWEMVEHAYATTVHKSQRGEYPMVILPWLPMFYKMLRRNIFYYSGLHMGYVVPACV